jgi:hypothetical protein
MKMYYTDPLKAAWMCREFGVKFQTEHGELMEYHHPFGWNSETESIGNMFQRFYIHPDSLALFQPKIGDWVQIINKATRNHGWIRHYTKSIAAHEKHGAYIRERFKNNNLRIIQRNNKAFFTPEVDNAAE